MNKNNSHSAHNKIVYNLLLYLVLFGPNMAVSAGTWQQQVSGISNSLISVFFLDNYSGWAVGGYGAIINTTDGGENWYQQTSGSNEYLNCVYFIDTATGWISGSNGTILKTTDGGNNWSSQNSLTIYELYSIYFADDSTGWAVGDGGTILKSTNGGANWLPVNSPFSGIISDLDFADSLNGWAAAFESGAITSTVLKTTDGGDSWQLITVATFPPWPVFSVDFIDTSTGWVVGYIEVIFKSTDGGITWIEQQGVSSTPEGFLSVSFADDNDGWAVGYEGVIAHTTNGGNLWIADTSGTTNTLWDVYFVTPNTGWIVGDDGLILKYTTPVFVEDNESDPVPDKFILYNNYPNPFNPSTKIKYSIPSEGTSSLKFIELKVFSVLGNEVATLVNEEQPSGEYEVVFNGMNLPSGIYFYRLSADNYTSVKKMILLK